MPESIPPTPAQGPQLPPIDPAALLATALAVLTRPAEFYKGIKGDASFQKPVVFAIAAGLTYGVLAGVGSFLWLLVGGLFGAALSALIGWVIAGLITGILGAFLGGLVVWGLSTAFGSKAPWESSIPIAAYAMAVAPAHGVLYLLPAFLRFLGVIVMLAAIAYQVYLCYVGARIINFDAPPAATTPPV